MAKENIYPISISEINENYDFYKEIPEIYKKAEDYLLEQPWCDKIYSADLYFNMGTTLSIFLFSLNNIQSDSDNKIWVIAGDIPCMYLDIVGAKSTKEVLLNYIQLSSDWIYAILKQKSVIECFPFDAASTKENALLLKSRIEFIKKTILENIEDLKIKD